MADGQKKKRQYRGEEFFRRVLAERSSGVSLHELARRNGVAGSVLCRWAQKLNSGEAAAGGVDAKMVRRGVAERGQRPTPALIPVTVIAPRSPAVDAPPSLVVELCGDRAVRVPPGFSAEELVRLIAAVEACPAPSGRGASC